MPANGYNIGRDLTLDIVDPVQGVLRFPLITSYKHTPKYKSLESNALDGIPRFSELPAGHELAVELDRASSRANDYFCATEVNYFNGVPNPQVSITETIVEVSGAVSQYRFTNCALSLADGGSWKGDGIVTQSIKVMASFKVKIA